MSRYVPTQPPTTPDIAQLQRWLREEMEQIRNATDDIYTLADKCVASFVAAGYGGVIDTGPRPFNVGLSYQDIVFSAGLLNTPKGITQDFANDGLRFDYPGVWLLDFRWNLEGFVGSNAGRVIYQRISNATTPGIDGPGIAVGIGRSVEDSYSQIVTLQEIAEDNVGDLFRAQIGGGDDVTGGEISSVEFSAVHVSEFKDAIDLNALEALSKRQRY